MLHPSGVWLWLWQERELQCIYWEDGDHNYEGWIFIEHERARGGGGTTQKKKNSNMYTVN
jgi:hypothetical protein